MFRSQSLKMFQNSPNIRYDRHSPMLLFFSFFVTPLVHLHIFLHHLSIIPIRHKHMHLPYFLIHLPSAVRHITPAPCLQTLYNPFLLTERMVGPLFHIYVCMCLFVVNYTLNTFYLPVHFLLQIWQNLLQNTGKISFS